jgi:two-component system, OmpR family, sensor histidine kinase RstB
MLEERRDHPGPVEHSPWDTERETSVNRRRGERREAMYPDAPRAEDVIALTFELIAHDLASPLASSRMAVEYLLHQSSQPDQARLLAAVSETLEDLDRMVHEMLGLAHLERTGFEQIDPGALARQCIADCSRPELVELRSATAQIEADPLLLKPAITNLLENALHHARTAVCMRVGPVTGGTLITVDDDGSGIPPDLRKLIFGPMVRLAPGARPGFGLGLALVRRVAELHGGSVWAERAPSGGARFCLQLPEKRAGSR